MPQRPGDRLGRDDEQVRAAARFAVGTAIGGVAFLVVAALWASGCDGETTATAACGGPQRIMLSLGAPVILFLGGLRAFQRTYQVWRARGTWWGWQGPAGSCYH